MESGHAYALYSAGRQVRILLLTHLLPYPLDSGAKVRQYYVLRRLAERHEVTLVCFSRPGDAPEAVEHLRGLCREVVTVPMRRSRVADGWALARSLASGRPFTTVRDERREMYQRVGVLAKQCDAIHADQLAMAPYALHAARVAAAAGRRPRLVLDAHNAYYLIPQRMAEATRNPLAGAFLRREAHLLAHCEAETYARFDHVLTVTDEDRACIQALFTRFGLRQPPMTTMPICIDAATPPLTRVANPRGLLLLGGLHWPPNADGARWCLRHVWPLVRARCPEARVFVVGARPPADIGAYGDFAGIRGPAQAGDAPVLVTGYVADPQPFLRESAALLAPLRSGGGMRVKIVEAMNWGLPVVSTGIGCEGIRATPGRDILVADSPTAFAEAVLSVLDSAALCDQLSANGRNLVADHYDWRKEYATLDTIYAADATCEPTPAAQRA